MGGRMERGISRSQLIEIRENLFEIPLPHLSLFKFKRGGSRNFGLEYSQLYSTDFSLDKGLDVSLATLLTDSRNFYKALNGICEAELHQEQLNGCNSYVYLANKSYTWNLFLSKVGKGLFFKMEREQPLEWLKTSPPRTPVVANFEEENIKIRAEPELFNGCNSSIGNNDTRMFSVLRDTINKAWSSTTETLKLKKLGKVALVGFLLEMKVEKREEKRDFCFTKLHKRRIRKPLIADIYSISPGWEELNEIKAVHRIRSLL